MNAHSAKSATTLQISVREARLTLERIFLAAGVPVGLVPAVREHALLSAALGLGGFEMVRAHHAGIGAATRPPEMAVDADPADADGELSIDAGGRHAWRIGATVLDLCIDQAHARGHGVAVVRNVQAPAELAVLTALAHRQGARADVRVAAESAPTGPGATGAEHADASAPAAAHGAGTLAEVRTAAAAIRPVVTIAVTPAAPPATLADWDPVLWRTLQNGLAVDAALWWELHQLAHRALSPDTIESRRHAGPIIVTDDGRIIGRPVDDDTDVTLLRRSAG